MLLRGHSNHLAISHGSISISKAKWSKGTNYITKLNHLKPLKIGELIILLKMKLPPILEDPTQTTRIDYLTNEGRTSKNFWKYIKNLRKDHVGVSPLKLNGRVLVDGAEKADAFFILSSLTNISPTCHQLTYTLLHLCLTFPFPLMALSTYCKVLTATNHPNLMEFQQLFTKCVLWRLLQYCKLPLHNHWPWTQYPMIGFWQM